MPKISVYYNAVERSTAAAKNLDFKNVFLQERKGLK